jgi:hypothetical protein
VWWILLLCWRVVGVESVGGEVVVGVRLCKREVGFVNPAQSQSAPPASLFGPSGRVCVTHLPNIHMHRHFDPSRLVAFASALNTEY